MDITTLLWLLIYALIFGGQSGEAQTAAPIENQREIYAVLNFGDVVFNPSDWMITFAQETGASTSVGWSSSTLGGVATVSLLPTGTTFDQAWFDGLMQYYQPYTVVGECAAEGVRLLEINGVSNGANYVTRYWIADFGGDRVLTVHLVFSEDLAQFLDQYGTVMFPNLPSCDA